MSRRDQIKMTDVEVADLLDAQRIVICATNGPDGWPHLMPLWYVMRQRDVWAWTYAKSQKVRNLERDPRATLQVEEGEQYNELRGIMIEARALIHRDIEAVTAVGAELLTRYGGGVASDRRDALRASAAKRVALQFTTERIASWDHAKLAGAH
jgi:PPOX class probable F420-dependent enzyme